MSRREELTNSGLDRTALINRIVQPRGRPPADRQVLNGILADFAFGAMVRPFRTDFAIPDLPSALPGLRVDGTLKSAGK